MSNELTQQTLPAIIEDALRSVARAASGGTKAQLESSIAANKKVVLEACMRAVGMTDAQSIGDPEPPPKATSQINDPEPPPKADG